MAWAPLQSFDDRCRGCGRLDGCSCWGDQMLDSLRYLASGDWRYLPWNVPIPQDEVSGELALALHRQEFNALAERIGEIIDSDPRRAMRMLWEFGERIGEEP